MDEVTSFGGQSAFAFTHGLFSGDTHAVKRSRAKWIWPDPATRKNTMLSPLGCERGSKNKRMQNHEAIERSRRIAGLEKEIHTLQKEGQQDQDACILFTDQNASHQTEPFDLGEVNDLVSEDRGETRKRG